MKRISIFVIFLGLLCSSAFSQVLTGNWQLQSNNPAVVETLNFGSGLFMHLGSNFDTGQVYTMQGRYVINKNIITFAPEGRNQFSLRLTWINGYTFTLSDDNTSSTFVRMVSDYNIPSVPNEPTYSTPNTTNTNRQPCWCCTGTGKCKVCSGKGKIGTIPPTTCTSCYGSGVCKYCNGTGIFNR